MSQEVTDFSFRKVRQSAIRTAIVGCVYTFPPQWLLLRMVVGMALEWIYSNV